MSQAFLSTHTPRYSSMGGGSSDLQKIRASPLMSAPSGTSWRAGKGVLTSCHSPRPGHSCDMGQVPSEERTGTNLPPISSPWVTVVHVRWVSWAGHWAWLSFSCTPRTLTLSVLLSSQTFVRIKKEGCKITAKKFSFLNRRYSDSDIIISDFKVNWNHLLTRLNFPHSFLLFSCASTHSFIFQPWERKHKKCALQRKKLHDPLMNDQTGHLLISTSHSIFLSRVNLI